jgi:hypothetical protein
MMMAAQGLQYTYVSRIGKRKGSMQSAQFKKHTFDSNFAGDYQQLY